MKKLLYLIPAALFFSCSAPKYAANIQQKEGNSSFVAANSSSSSANEAGEVVLTASTKSLPATMEQAKKEIQAAYQNMSKAERKEVRQLLKKEIKMIAKGQKKEASVNAVAAKGGIDHDLKLAAIFGAVGIVALLLGTAGQAFVVIGAIALIIGVVFFVKWLLEQ